MNYLIFKKSLDRILKIENIKTNEYYSLLNQLKTIINKIELDNKDAIQIHFIIYQLSLINRDSNKIKLILCLSSELINSNENEKLKSKLKQHIDHL